MTVFVVYRNSSLERIFSALQGAKDYIRSQLEDSANITIEWKEQFALIYATVHDCYTGFDIEMKEVEE